MLKIQNWALVALLTLPQTTTTFAEQNRPSKETSASISRAEDQNFEARLFELLKDSVLTLKIPAKKSFQFAAKPSADSALLFEVCDRNNQNCKIIHRSEYVTSAGLNTQVPLTAFVGSYNGMMRSTFRLTITNAYQPYLGFSTLIDASQPTVNSPLGGVIRRTMMGPVGRFMTLRNFKNESTRVYLSLNASGKNDNENLIQDQVTGAISNPELAKAIAKIPNAKSMNLTSEFPSFTSLLSGDVGVREGYTLKEHNLRVLRKLQPLLKCFNIESKKKFMNHLMVLHDIGKPASTYARQNGYATGDQQHEFSSPIVISSMKALGYAPAEATFAEALVNHDIMGDLAKGNLDARTASQLLEAQAKKAKVGTEVFVRHQLAYYFADAGSYPYVYSNFMFSDSAGCVHHRQIDNLLATFYPNLKY